MENPFAMVALAARYAVERWQHSRDRASRGFDDTLGVDTHAWTLSGYEPTPLPLLEALFAELPVAGRTFVDVGCGKGRVLLWAARSPFVRVVGVEHDAALADIARRNLRRAVDPQRRCRDVDVVTDDAAAAAWPLGPLVVFLYNPFDAAVMVEVVASLERSLAAHPRPCRVVYVHPLCADAWSGWTVAADRGFGPERVLQLERGAA